MRIHLPDGTAWTYGEGEARLAELLLSIGVNPVEVIVSREGKVIPEDTILGADDEIRILRVSHGG